MKKFAIAAIAALSVAGSTAVYAQYHQPWSSEHMQRMRINPEDRAAFVDARIAAVHAGLKLNADQEKLWPPVENAVRDFAKLLMERANARMSAMHGESDDQQQPDPIARLRQRADNMGVTSAALKKIADAADPLYKTLDEGQKRRLAVLTHHRPAFGGEGWQGRRSWMGRGMGMGSMGMGGMEHPHGDHFMNHDGGSDEEEEGSH